MQIRVAQRSPFLYKVTPVCIKIPHPNPLTKPFGNKCIIRNKIIIPITFQIKILTISDTWSFFAAPTLPVNNGRSQAQTVVSPSPNRNAPTRGFSQ